MRTFRAIAVALGLVLLTSAACRASPSVAQPATAVPRAAPVATIAASPTTAPVTHLIFTGDIIPARCTYAKLAALGDYTAPFHALHDILAGADIAVGTLDSTLSDASRPFGCVETFNLAAPAAATEGLRYAGFDVISHAANHIKDCGAINCGDRSLFDTIANLRAAGIAPVGSGANVVEARAPAVITRNGVRFAFLAYDDVATWYHATDTTAGSAPLDEATLAADIAAARRVADVVVVLPQWGIEYTLLPTERQRRLARIAADAGAALVVGNHPHWAQAHESIGRTHVAYALGNFVFDQDWSLLTQQGVLLEATFTGPALTDVRYLAVRIHDQYQPRLMDPTAAQQFLARLEAASASLTAPE